MDPKTRTAFQAAGVVVTMGALAWASVPFYDWFCRVTGFGGDPGIAVANESDVLDRTIRVRFDASVERDMPWEFEPVIRTVEVPIGETAIAFYEATNPLDVPVAGRASYNVAPFEAGGFFTKIDCFCFEEQLLRPGETMRMPVTFFVDPEIVDDRDAQFVHTITLSYTFHRLDDPTIEQAALNDEPSEG
ncbi:cytochrome c oxidase assembly protein subunit 11 [Hasllibacter halocynthiae]|uniref:Cytochrome c oxidase assembly protein CtaG n=1 Tax=Hasllibacter halocynthiae TaxID=595589 RepID=A0A2T0X9J2_9RHOB|nr:cytochrome c oxidase assembly protein [Hasllibacter halocynthiae]PRY95606.1 cytochrome c oxidase assembly protein subunit 11 [Hasllibacter halocynthiae]